MSPPTMTSLERVVATLGGHRPDRVPFFLSAGLHGPRLLSVTMREYFASAELMAAGQVEKRRRYRDDVVTSFAYAAVEAQAFGQDVVIYPDGPPNAGAPIIERVSDIERLAVPDIDECEPLQRCLEVTRRLAVETPDAAILGIVMAPNSLPVMQMGFERYLDLMHDDPALHRRLLDVNERFCVQWANAQLEAGAHAIGVFDPVSSPTIVPRETFLRTGYESAKRVFSAIEGTVLALLASGAVIPVIDDFVGLGVAAMGIGPGEDVAEARRVAAGRCTLVGNLNGIEMRRWTPQEAASRVEAAIRAGGPDHFLLCDGHGEIPFEVSEDVLVAISEAALRWGNLPSA